MGAPREGICRADAGRPYWPTGQLLVTGCNMGYARDRCERVPADAPDAARFVYAGPGIVRWVLETDHRPVSCGVSEQGSSAGQGTVLDSQLNAYRSALEEPASR